MLRCPGVPLLPGSTFRDITKNKFHKSQHWAYNRDIPVLVEAIRPGIGGEPLTHPPYNLPSVYPPHLGPKLPPWLAFDKKVLCFRGYFKETLQECYKAPFQVRRIKLYFYLEDDTMQITEPRTGNSGIPQGCLVSRQRVPRPAPYHHEFLTILDLNVNKLVQVYDRIYHITDCDLYTRHFLNRLGIPVPDRVEIPADPTAERRKNEELDKLPKRPSTTIKTFGQFLQNDRKVLRFRAYWDDRQSEFGDVRDLMLYYFLADDTIQIKEVLPINSGRDTGGAFLKRCKLPKDFDGLPLLGQETPFTVLNVFGVGSKGSRYIPDTLGVGSKEREYYKDRDLTIGTSLNVYGREVVLIDCDDFTKEYYRKKYGMEDFTALSKPYEFGRFVKPLSINERELPPFNGYGTHEDSEGNCKTVEPKAPHRDFNKFINLDGYILRFGATLLSSIRENSERVFIISYYLSDDTIAVYEPAIRNSGFKGGDFFKRSQIMLPNQEIFTPHRPRLYTPQHFFIGAIVDFRNFKFQLISADEFALSYMEKKPNEFPYSNVNNIMAKVKDAVQPIYKDFVAKNLPNVANINCGGTQSILVICYNEMKNALIELLGNKINDQEVISLCRHFAAERKSPQKCDRERVRSVTHLELIRNLWNNMERLKEHLYHVDPSNSGFMSEPKLLSAIRGSRLPLDIQLIKNMFSVLNRDEEMKIDLDDFLKFIDLNITSCPIQPLNTKRDVCPDIPFTQAGRLVNWDAFLQYLGLEEDLKKEAD